MKISKAGEEGLAKAGDIEEASSVISYTGVRGRLFMDMDLYLSLG